MVLNINMDDDENKSVAQPIFNHVGPHIKEWLSGYILVGFRADNDVGVVVCDCPDIQKRDDMINVIKAAEDWGGVKLYEE